MYKRDALKLLESYIKETKKIKAYFCEIIELKRSLKSANGFDYTKTPKGKSSVRKSVLPYQLQAKIDDMEHSYYKAIYSNLVRYDIIKQYINKSLKLYNRKNNNIYAEYYNILVLKYLCGYRNAVIANKLNFTELTILTYNNDARKIFAQYMEDKVMKSYEDIENEIRATVDTIWQIDSLKIIENIDYQIQEFEEETEQIETN